MKSLCVVTVGVGWALAGRVLMRLQVSGSPRSLLRMTVTASSLCLLLLLATRLSYGVSGDGISNEVRKDGEQTPSVSSKDDQADGKADTPGSEGGDTTQDHEDDPENGGPDITDTSNAREPTVETEE